MGTVTPELRRDYCSCCLFEVQLYPKTTFSAGCLRTKVGSQDVENKDRPLAGMWTEGDRAQAPYNVSWTKCGHFQIYFPLLEKGEFVGIDMTKRCVLPPLIFMRITSTTHNENYHNMPSQCDDIKRQWQSLWQWQWHLLWQWQWQPPVAKDPPRVSHVCHPQLALVQDRQDQRCSCVDHRL